MRVHAILLREPNADVERRLSQHYKPKDWYKVSDVTFLVRGPQTTTEIADIVGLRGEDRVVDATGGVFQLTHSFGGFSSADMWEWLEESESSLV